MIRSFHDYTHFEKFEEDIKNSDFRALIRMLADVLMYMMNCSSNAYESGIYEFDKERLLEKIDNVRREINYTKNI